MERWVGRVALVTGASGGIGAAICRQLVKQGMSVMGVARNVEKIEAMAAQEEIADSPGKLHAWKCDMSVEAEILSMYEEIRKKYGRIDVCVNNAMSTRDSSLLTGETSDWRYLIELGVIGVCINTREAVKLMREKDINDGHIINMGSIVGHKIPSFQKPPEGSPSPWFPIYNGSKWMLRSLTESLRLELRTINSNIRVTLLSPGAVETKLMSASVSEADQKLFFSYYKVLQPKDIADAVVHVLSTPEHVNVHDIIMEPLSFQI